jgi:hypothetical protein
MPRPNRYPVELVAIASAWVTFNTTCCPEAMASPAPGPPARGKSDEKVLPGASAAAASPANSPQSEANERVRAWFESYDDIRRRSQMTPAERKQADDLLQRGFTLLLPGFGRIAVHRLLRKMISRYQTAASAMRELTPPPETRELHEGYTRYFLTASRLFADTRHAIGNPFRSRKGLSERKEDLAQLESSLKSLDKQLRDKYGIKPYESQAE